MTNKNWHFRRYYFITSFAVISAIAIFMGSYFVIGQYKEYKFHALKDKLSFISYKKDLIKNYVDVVVQQININIENSEKNLRQRIKNRVYKSYLVAESLYAKALKVHGKEAAIDIVKTALGNVVYGSNYLFIFDKRGVILTSPLLKNIEGKNLLNKKDSKGRYIMRESIALVEKDGEGFYSTYWEQPGKGEKLREKIVFLKEIEGTDMVLGYGEYLDDFHAEIQKSIVEQVESIHFENGGYIFIADWDGVSLTKPAKNKNMINVHDVNGKFIVRDMIAKSKAGGGFYEYVMPPFKGAKPENKLSYVAPIEKFGWYVGTGMYLTDIENSYESRLKNLSENLKEEIVFIVLITLFFLMLAGFLIFFFSNNLQELINRYNLEIKEKNEQLSDLNASLEAKVEEKTSELNELNKSLEQKIAHEVAENREKDRIMFQQGRHAAMGEMIGNIAHQWRQPLNTVSLLVQDIQEAYEYGELDSAYLEESVHKCTSTIAHMSETIDDFRGFFNPSKDMTDFDINSEVKKALGLIDASFMNNNISIKLDIDKEVMAHGVSGEYSQVIVSILNNARDVLLNRKVESPEVSISTSYRDDMAVLEIEDNGGGILIEDINKIFEPYFTTKPKSEGTGIGLYFSKIIIEKHMSGYIKVENTERGAIFIVAVPGIFSD